jgi:transglutaminase-like putative cysteine protease
VRYRVTHATTYHYEELVSIGHNELRLEPRGTATERCLATELAIEPTPAVRAGERDYFGNPTSFFTLQEPHHLMRIVATSELEVRAAEAPPPERTPAWDALRDGLRGDFSAAGLRALEMCFASPLVPVEPAFAEYARPSFAPGRPIAEAVLELTRRVHEEFEYRPGATSVGTPVAEVLEQRSGVCQDFAHLEIACLRALGLAARYVSGYIRTLPAPGAAKLVGADASHAWLAVWCGESGWLGVDPTNDLVVSDQHVTVAWGRDYGDVAPIKGVVLGGGGHTVDVAVQVEPLD